MRTWTLACVSTLALLAPFALTGCPADGGLDTGTGMTATTSPSTSATMTMGEETGTSSSGPTTLTATGDGDGDMTTGDGDGDTTTTGDGDGDTTTSGDGDGDGDTTDTDNPACEDGDSGDEPWEPELEVDEPETDNEDEPHGPMFVPQVDIPINECFIFDQDCPDGEKCVPYASGGGNWDANKCVPVMGDAMVGEPCVYGGVVEATDDCDANSACWGIDNMGMGTCTAFCGGTPQAPECPAGTACLTGGDGSIAFCVPNCNPITQDCPDGDACYFTNEGFTCVFTTQDIPNGEVCGFINDCAKGNACTNGAVVPNCAGNACCAAFCDLDCGTDICDQPDTECVPFFAEGQAPMGSADVGICITP